MSERSSIGRAAVATTTQGEQEPGSSPGVPMRPAMLCGASHQWQVDRAAPWVPVRFRMLRFHTVFSFLEPSCSGEFPFFLFYGRMKEKEV